MRGISGSNISIGANQKGISVDYMSLIRSLECTRIRSQLMSGRVPQFGCSSFEFYRGPLIPVAGGSSSTSPISPLEDEGFSRALTDPRCARGSNLCQPATSTLMLSLGLVGDAIPS